jgi:quercetin dioxygenase-like cupin family protein
LEEKKMKVFDLGGMEVQPYAQRDLNVFYRAPEFKARIIELPQGGEIPKCEMSDHVIFFVLAGQADVTVNGQTSSLGERQCLITAPATFSMKTEKGARLVGIQIAARPPY